MTIEEKVYALLSAALPAYGSPVSEVVPANRIKPLGDWQNLARPYIVHFPVSLEPTQVYGGRAGLNRWFYQVSCFADTHSGARAVADAVTLSLQGLRDDVHFFLRDHATQFEPDTNISHIALTFEIFEALNS
jgi:hypothetical protein